MSVVAKRERLSRSRIIIWVVLLALAQVADLVTTQAAMSRGAVEGNMIASGIMGAGGIALLWLVKGMLVAAMAVAVWLVRRYWDSTRDGRAAVVATLVWRGLQVCVAVLAFTAIHNVAVMTGIAY
jgi:hypothetical protein